MLCQPAAIELKKRTSFLSPFSIFSSQGKKKPPPNVNKASGGSKKAKITE